MFSGPATFCQRSQCAVPFTISTQHAEQSGACPAALEEAGPGTEEVCVRPPCCSQLNPALRATGRAKQQQKNTVTEPSIYIPFSHLWFVSHQV